MTAVVMVSVTSQRVAGSDSRASAGSLPRIHASPNRRFLATENGKPFFWLAGTGWWLTGIAPADVDFCLAKRAEQRFNVIQFHCGRREPSGNQWLRWIPVGGKP